MKLVSLQVYPAALLCLCLRALAADVTVKHDIPPFSAEANVSMLLFREPRQPIPSETLRFSISFSWSNGLWQVERTSESTPGFVRTLRGTNVPTTTVIDCKRVPGGVRYYSVFPNTESEAAEGVLPFVEVLPTAFPPINFRELLLCWLALCPNAELPTVSSNQMRRFTSQKRLDEPDNVGEYHASYLETNAFFLSDLSVSDNGEVHYLDGRVRHRPAPFAEGFTDFHFRTLETTNVNGIAFPKRAELRLLALGSGETNQDNSWATLVCSLDVTQIQAPPAPSKSRNMTLFVSDISDKRPFPEPGPFPRPYIVTNDTFPLRRNEHVKGANP